MELGCTHFPVHPSQGECKFYAVTMEDRVYQSNGLDKLVETGFQNQGRNFHFEVPTHVNKHSLTDTYFIHNAVNSSTVPHS